MGGTAQTIGESIQGAIGTLVLLLLAWVERFWGSSKGLLSAAAGFTQVVDLLVVKNRCTRQGMGQFPAHCKAASRGRW